MYRRIAFAAATLILAVGGMLVWVFFRLFVMKRGAVPC